MMYNMEPFMKSSVAKYLTLAREFGFNANMMIVGTLSLEEEGARTLGRAQRSGRRQRTCETRRETTRPGKQRREARRRGPKAARSRQRARTERTSTRAQGATATQERDKRTDTATVAGQTGQAAAIQRHTPERAAGQPQRREQQGARVAAAEGR